MQQVSTKNRIPLIAQIGLLIGPFLTMMDANIINVALSDISSKLNTSLTNIQWIVSGYMLALSAIIAASAFLAKRFGSLKIYFISIIGFTFGSMLCGLSDSYTMLLFSRIIQGIFGAPMLPLAMDMLLGGKKEKNRDIFNEISPLMGIMLFLAPAIGPTIGGLLIQVPEFNLHFFDTLVQLGGWHLIFWINVPIGIVGMIAAQRIPHRYFTKADQHVSFDLFGLMMLSGGLTAITYGTSVIPTDGWLSTKAWPFWAIGAALVVAYIFWSRKKMQPVVNLKLFSNLNAALSVAIASIAAIVMFSMLILIPIYTENIQGYSVLKTGFALLPQGIVTGFGTILGNYLPKRIGIRNSVMSGMIILIGGTLSLQILTFDSSIWLTASLLIIRAFAMGLVIQPLLMELIGSLPAEETADANTLFNVAQRIGAAVGIAILISYFTSREVFHINHALSAFGVSMSSSGGSKLDLSQIPAILQGPVKTAAVSGFHDAIWLLTAFAVLGFIVSIFLRKPSNPNATGHGSIDVF